MQLIGLKNNDEKYTISMSVGDRTYEVSEYIPIAIRVTAPIDKVGQKPDFPYSVSLYSFKSNSRPSPTSASYWDKLVPTWKFYDDSGKQTNKIKFSDFDEYDSENMIGIKTLYVDYVDDLPSDQAGVKITAVLESSDMKFINEQTRFDESGRGIPSHSNSKVSSDIVVYVSDIGSEFSDWVCDPSEVDVGVEMAPCSVKWDDDHGWQLYAGDNLVQDDISYDSDATSVQFDNPFNVLATRDAVSRISGIKAKTSPDDDISTGTFWEDDHVPVIFCAEIDRNVDDSRMFSSDMAYGFPNSTESVQFSASAFVAVASGVPVSYLDDSEPVEWEYVCQVSGYSMKDRKILSGYPEFKLIDNDSAPNSMYNTGGYTMGVIRTDAFHGTDKIMTISGICETGEGRIECKLNENTFKVETYEKYKIRKHNEDWDASVSMKTPIVGTRFEENKTLFDMIGETLGTNKHGNYSVTRKLYEGIANQVENVHDIDECHIDNIYTIADKEDFPMDNFVLSYPEEMRRITDLMSIKKKKLWGDRCHCNSNYFKSRKNVSEKELESIKSSEREKAARLLDEGKISKEEYEFRINEINTYNDGGMDVRKCRNCGHVHSSNVGSLIDPQSYAMASIETDQETGERTWDPENTDPYLIENLYNRNKFTRIIPSTTSMSETFDILVKMDNQIRNQVPKYLTDEEIEQMDSGKQSKRIILYVSVLELKNKFRDCFGSVESIFDDERLFNEAFLGVHTSLFSEDHWFNYCFWKFIDDRCNELNTSVINWESEYNNLAENADDGGEKVKTEEYNNWDAKNGTIEKIVNGVLHNGCLFNVNGEYRYD